MISEAFGAEHLGQNCPQEYPQPESASGDTGALGEPLSIREVAALIGCSVWTVRQRYLPAGLPHLRMRPHGKLIFYRNQIIHWLLTEQQKGGTSMSLLKRGNVYWSYLYGTASGMHSQPEPAISGRQRRSSSASGKN